MSEERQDMSDGSDSHVGEYKSMNEGGSNKNGNRMYNAKGVVIIKLRGKKKQKPSVFFVKKLETWLRRKKIYRKVEFIFTTRELSVKSRQ